MWGRSAIFIVTALVGLSATPNAVSAFSLGHISGFMNAFSGPKYLAEKGPTLAPMGHVVFCQKNLDQCATKGKAAVDLTTARLAELVTVNSRVNRQIDGTPDTGTNGFNDVWNASVSSGDCEDFALTKRQQLVQRGWPERALRIAVAKTRGGVGHAVLVVRTTKGDLVLDNLEANILPWHKAKLVWEKIQSVENLRMWRSL